MTTSPRFALFAALFASAAALAACEEPPAPVVPPQPPPPPPTMAPQPPPPSGPAYVDESAMDPSAKPCDDFYQYACGNWIKSAQIPPDENAWSRSFDVINQNNEKVLRDILEQDAKAPGSDAYAKQLGDLYAACMDEDGIEKAGTAPIAELLKTIDKIRSPKDLAAALGTFHKRGLRALFDYDSGQDFKDATQVIGQLSQARLGLPDRDYYLKDTKNFKEARATYEAHVARMLALLGDKEKDAKEGAARVLAFETALARAAMPRVDMRDPQKVYHRMDRPDLDKQSEFPWPVYFKAVGTPDVKPMNVAQPNFFKAIDLLMSASPSVKCDAPKPKTSLAPPNGPAPKGAPDAKPVEDTSPITCAKQPKQFPAADVKAYLRYHLVKGLARWLPKRFDQEGFTLEKSLFGTEQQPPRWKRCVRAVDGMMGEALAQPFVKKMLGEDGKQATRHMVQLLEEGMRDNLKALSWMDDATRTQAVGKLGAIVNKIGYPDKWRNYDALVVKRDDALGNRNRAVEVETTRQLAKIGKPLDRNEWEMTPPTVNAYYEPTMNEIVFPAGILQAPFYSREFPMAMNYGAIGMVIGHELTHGFDDEGRQFDGQGNLRDWWSASVSQQFDQRASCVEKQFDEYTVLDGVHVNGKLTLGENIADLGGLKIALAAYHKDTAAARMAPGKYTEEQMFFLGYAQGWCGKMRDETLRVLVQTNPHSPEKLRVNGPVSNLPEFAQAFQCAPGSPMVRANRCEVW